MADFEFTSPDALNNLGNAVVRYKQNIEALRILHSLKAQQSTPTSAQLQALSRYVGWGSSELINRAFPRSHQGQPAKEIEALLSQDEITQLRSSSLTAVFTPLPIIAAIYDILDYLGLANLPSLRVLDPATGTGHFIGAMPGHLRQKADCVAVEIDHVSAAITRLLYPTTKLHQQPFEDVVLPRDFFDLVIGNVPFGDYPVADNSINERYLKQQIHDYFFVKSVALAKPGAVIVFITSTGTLDKKDDRVRRYLSKHAELLTALRLPNDAFTQHTSTEVITDLVLLRKRYRPDDTAPDREAWIQTEETSFPLRRGGTATTIINRTFIDDPSRILGTPLIAPSIYNGSEQLIVSPNTVNLRQTIVDAVRLTLPHNLLLPATTSGTSNQPKILSDQDIRQDAQSELNSATSSFHGNQTQGSRATALVDIYAAAKKVLNLQLLNNNDSDIQSAQATLNTLYDNFTSRFGYINSKHNQSLFRRDNPFVSFLRALEDKPPTGGFTKAKLFHTRTINAHQPATQANNPNEALLHCLNERGSVDLDFISALSRTTKANVIASLKGLIFQTPTGNWVTADEYLSGDVRTKLLEAQATAAIDPTFQANVDALQEVQPRPLGAGEIIARLGAGWVPQNIVTAFANALVPDYKGDITYNAPLARWIVPPASYSAATSFDATQRWGTPRAHAIELLEDALNLRRTAVYDEKIIGKDKVRVLNLVDTAAAQAKLTEIKDHFMEWVWDDPVREQTLTDLYNQQYNVYRTRQFDGSHLTLPGTATSETLKPHQKDSVWRALQCRTGLLPNHPVGSGKTYIGVASAMELRRLGLANKPLVTVPSIAVSTWVTQAQTLYPNIRLLTTDVNDFSKERRGETLSRIATGDWDLIIIPHSSFKLLPLMPATLRRFVQRELDTLRSYILDLEKEDDKASRRSIKQLERRAKILEAQLKGEDGIIRRDDERTITWEELGIDALLVDEFDAFKNLGFATKMTRIAGLPNSHSQQAFDMHVKIEYLREHGGRVIALTATAISNTVAEIYTIQRYLQPELLERLGLSHFDAWAQMFGDTVTELELKVDGSGWRQHTRFAKFVNVPELSRQLQQVLDIRTKKDLNIPTPALIGGSSIIEEIEPSPAQQQFTQTLALRADAIKTGSIRPNVDNMLMVTSDGRKAALDIRLVCPDLPEDPDSKINHVANNVHAVWQRTHTNAGAQLLFLDLSVPKPTDPKSILPTIATDELDSSDETQTESLLRQSLYHEIKNKLIRKGIPEAQIQFVHSADTQTKKARLIENVNAGKVRILLGSTSKMGVAMNAQERLIALHHIDAPWRPRDVEQREGRILRQGNIYDAVFIFQYVTKGSMDCYTWQILESKARFIHQILSGEITQRTAEDIGDMVLTTAQVKAIASGNPQVMQRVQLELNLIKLERLRAAYYNNRSAMRHELSYLPDQIKSTQSEIDWHQQTLAIRQPPLLDDDFAIQIKKTFKDEHFTVISKRQDAGRLLRHLSSLASSALNKAKRGSQIHEHVGMYRGFKIFLHGSSDIFQLNSLFNGNIEIQLYPENETRPYYASLTDTDVGIIQSIDHQLRSIETYLDDATNRKLRLDKKLADLQNEVTQPWKHLTEYRQMRHHYEQLAIQLHSQGINVESAVRFTNLTDEELAAAPDDTLPTQPQPVYAVQTNQRNPFTGREPDLIIAPNDPRQTIPQFNTSAQTLTDVANIEDSHDTKDKTNTTPQPPPTHIQHRTPGAHQLGFAFLFIEHEPQAHVHPQ
jgi:N12 class adenine-specific DNA methylase